MNLSFGFLPDLLRGKKLGEALNDSVTQGAVIGATMYGLPAVGAAVAPTAGATTAGAVPTLEAANYSLNAGNAASQGLKLGQASQGASAGGLLKDYAAPAMQSLQAASLAKGLMADSPIQAPQPQGINPQGAQTLAQLAQQGQMSPEELMKQRRQTMWG